MPNWLAQNERPTEHAAEHAPARKKVKRFPQEPSQTEEFELPETYKQMSLSSLFKKFLIDSEGGASTKKCPFRLTPDKRRLGYLLGVEKSIGDQLRVLSERKTKKGRIGKDRIAFGQRLLQDSIPGQIETYIPETSRKKFDAARRKGQKEKLDFLTTAFGGLDSFPRQTKEHPSH